MIIFINGPFGVGKTTAANLVVEKCPNALLYDPEEVGYLLRNILVPIHTVDDFQSYALWPTLVVEVARLLKKEYDRTLVIPMSVWRYSYFDEIAQGLRGVDEDLLCFRLTVSREVLVHRILSRPDAEAPHDWCLAHVDVCLDASHDPRFGTEVDTSNLSPQRVADAILAGVADKGGFSRTRSTRWSS